MGKKTARPISFEIKGNIPVHSFLLFMQLPLLFLILLTILFLFKGDNPVSGELIKQLIDTVLSVIG